MTAAAQVASTAIHITQQMQCAQVQQADHEWAAQQQRVETQAGGVDPTLGIVKTLLA